MITEYSPEFKESLLQKIFFNPDRTVVSFAREASIPGSTVATWVRN
ncbi:transposase, partial [Desulfobacula sp.]